MDMLLRGGADINAVDTSFQDNRTALHKACDVGFPQGIALLLKWGGNTSLRDATQLTPLQVAIQQGHLNCVRLLWDSNRNERDDQGLLALAINSGQIEVVTLFFGQEQGIAHERHVAQCTQKNIARQQEKDRLRLIDQQASRNASVVGGGGRAAATVPAEVDNSMAEEEEEEDGDEKLIQQPLVHKISSLLTVTSSRRRNKK
jgi:ankyrin repeat protein